MPFEYVGLKSLRDPAVFQQILASSVEFTGLANDFRICGYLRVVHLPATVTIQPEALASRS